MDKVSFIIRTLNEGEFLESVLNSIHSQNNQDFEVVIVDSGSTDSTLEIAESFNCKVVEISKEDWSWGRSLNWGIASSNYDILCVISGHCDLTTPDFIDNAIAKMSDYDVVYGKQVPKPSLDPFEEFELYQWYPDHEISDNRDLILRGRGVGVSNACAVFRKEVWLDEKFDESLQSMEDAYWAFKQAQKGKRICYTNLISVYHSHPINTDYIYKKWYCRQFEGYDFLNKELGLYKTNLYGQGRFLLSSIYRFVRTPFDALTLKKFTAQNGYNVSYKHTLTYFFIRNFAIHKAYLDYKNKVSINYSRTKSSFISKVSNFVGFEKIDI